MSASASRDASGFRQSIKKYRWFVAGVLLLTIAPFVGPLLVGQFFTFLLIEAMVFAIFALGYDVMIGKTGMISFGHAGFFGLGVYVGGLTLVFVSEGVIPMLLAGVIAAVVFAIVVGFFSLRLTGVYFALLTFAFAQILYEITVRIPEITGGYNGLSVPIPKLLGVVQMSDFLVYYIVLLFMVFSYLAVRRIMNSPLGLVFTVIGENEQRTEFLGYDVNRYKHTSFVLSGAISGLAGVLFLLSENFASPNNLYWFLSGRIIVMTLFGGVGTLYGPMIGAGIIIYLETFLTTITEAWPVILGIIFVIVVLFFPDGLIGTLSGSSLSRLTRRFRPTEQEADSTPDD